MHCLSDLDLDFDLVLLLALSESSLTGLQQASRQPPTNAIPCSEKSTAVLLATVARLNRQAQATHIRLQRGQLPRTWASSAVQ